MLLTWLHANHIDPGEGTQADFDTWYASHHIHQHQRVRGFLACAIDHGPLPRRPVLHRVAFKPGTVTQQRRLALLRRYVTEDTAPLPTQVAACLLLLFAQPLIIAELAHFQYASLPVRSIPLRRVA